MSILRRTATILAIGALCAGPALPAAPQTASLTVKVTGIVPQPSTLIVGLYDASDWRNPNPQIRQSAAASGQDLSFTFNDLPPGVIAVKVLQDLNNNGKMDKTLIGAPDEPFGMSNNIEPGMSMPDFDEVAITLAPGPNAITITMQEW